LLSFSLLIAMQLEISANVFINFSKLRYIHS
jgi:hypothetical protein